MIELLAPAGNLECAIAAFEAGADAVYCGLERFNARERNQNFTFEEMSRLSFYTKERGKRFYVTFNTLIKDGEIDSVVQELEGLSRLEPDALIIQDLGVLKLCRDFFPELRLHASTQMGIHNSVGVSLAQKLGIQRVILERQVTLQELKLIAQRKQTEIEVFIHGALCCSLSGMCHWSSIQGGFSGNRGKCKQSCRRVYQNQKAEESPFFSPNDLETVNFIESFKEMQIDSLKIEGRLKRSDYIKQTVSAYRLLLDNNANDIEIQKRAYELLKGTAVRPFSHGFYTAESRYHLLGNPQGQTGEVVAQWQKGNKNQGEAKALQTISKGDKIRIPQGDRSQIITLTHLTVDNKKVYQVKPNQIFRFNIEEKSKFPEKGEKLYRIGRQVSRSNESLMRLKCFDERFPLALKVEVDGKTIRVSAKRERSKEGDDQTVVWEEAAELPQAQNAPLSETALSAIFKHCGGSNWKTKTLTVSVKGCWFATVSQQKQWRRALEAAWEENPLEPKQIKEKIKECIEKRKNQKSEDKTVTVTSLEKKKEIQEAIFSSTTVKKGVDEWVLPLFLPENEVEGLQCRIDQAAAQGIRRFRITSLYQLSYQFPSDALLTAAHPLPAVNGFAAGLLLSLGCHRIQIWPELSDEEALEAAEHFGCPCERWILGEIPLLTTRAPLKEGLYRSVEKNEGLNHWQVRHQPQGDLFQIFPEASFNASPLPRCGSYISSQQNFKKIVVTFSSMR